MPIFLIDKIKQKNNGSFKLMDAQDVEYNGKGLDETIQDLEKRPTGSGYTIGEGLKLEGNTLSVNTTNEVEQDNTLPITSSAVHMTVGNINELLKTI